MIDSHCHLAGDAFDADRAAVVDRARMAGLSGALCILAAEDAGELARAEELARLWPAVRFAMGIHPHQAGQFAGRESAVEQIVRDAVGAQPLARAIGEIGLDYHYDFAPKPVQHDVFRRQLRLARELGLPVVVHTREAEEDTVAILEEESGGAVRGVLHCFTGTRWLAEQGLRLGMHISFAGIITFPKGGNVREIVPFVPDDRVLCETDSPYLAPTPHRGKRNEPAWVVRVAEALASLRGTSADAIHRHVVDNFSALFRP